MSHRRECSACCKGRGPTAEECCSHQLKPTRAEISRGQGHEAKSETHCGAGVPAADGLNAFAAPHARSAVEVEEAAGTEVHPLLALAVVVERELLGLQPREGPANLSSWLLTMREGAGFTVRNNALHSV